MFYLDILNFPQDVTAPVLSLFIMHPGPMAKGIPLVEWLSTRLLPGSLGFEALPGPPCWWHVHVKESTPAQGWSSTTELRVGENHWGAGYIFHKQSAIRRNRRAVFSNCTLGSVGFISFDLCGDKRSVAHCHFAHLKSSYFCLVLLLPLLRHLAALVLCSYTDKRTAVLHRVSCHAWKQKATQCNELPGWNVLPFPRGAAAS